MLCKHMPPERRRGRRTRGEGEAAGYCGGRGRRGGGNARGAGAATGMRLQLELQWETGGSRSPWPQSVIRARRCAARSAAHLPRLSNSRPRTHPHRQAQALRQFTRCDMANGRLKGAQGARGGSARGDAHGRREWQQVTNGYEWRYWRHKSLGETRTRSNSTKASRERRVRQSARRARPHATRGASTRTRKFAGRALIATRGKRRTLLTSTYSYSIIRALCQPEKTNQADN